jgi:hypothetical protein
MFGFSNNISSARSRSFIACLMVLVIVAGLLWRSSLGPTNPSVRKYGGDALWALLVFLGFRFLFPTMPTRLVALLAVVFSFGVETSQLYHTPWIDGLRSTRLGGLVLGSGFNWPDFAAYSLGIGVGSIEDWAWRRLGRILSPTES